MVGIVRCSGLAAMDSNGYSDPYVKVWVYSLGRSHVTSIHALEWKQLVAFVFAASWTRHNSAIHSRVQWMQVLFSLQCYCQAVHARMCDKQNWKNYVTGSRRDQAEWVTCLYCPGRKWVWNMIIKRIHRAFGVNWKPHVNIWLSVTMSCEIIYMIKL